jgi:elongation factor P
MFNINDIKNGVTFKFEGDIYEVVEFQHVKPGKGPAFMNVKMRNLRTGSIVEKKFNTTNVKLEKANIEKRPMQFLYSAGDTYTFMNMETYEQVELNAEQLGDQKDYLKEGLDVNLTFFEGELLGVNLPDKVTLEVTDTEPATRGNTANNALKDATLETGLVVKVPLFINKGDQIIVSTKTGYYDSRA